MIRKIKDQLKKTFLLDIYLSYKAKVKTRWAIADFKQKLEAFRADAERKRKRFSDEYQDYKILFENTSDTQFEPHYLYHPAWAARVLAQTKPNLHVDISSTLNFCSIVSAFIPVDFYDYRPANVFLSGLNSKHADLTQLHFNSNSIPSLSCMHTVEHIGLGRYGDPIDYDGDLKAIEELKRVLAVDGNLLFVVPIGKPLIAYNAHRIYAYKQIISYFEPLKLVEFSLVPDNFENIGIIKNASEIQADEQHWGCGCFWFKKPQL